MFSKRITILLWLRAKAAEPEYLYCIKPRHVVCNFMRVPLTTIGLLILFFTSCKSVSASHEVNKEQLVACETGNGNCRPIEVIRQKTGSKTSVSFLISSNRMQMRLFDATYPKQIEHVHEDSIKPIFSDFVKENNRPSFDLTSLPDGRYYVHIIGDEVGGVFEFNLKTKS